MIELKKRMSEVKKYLMDNIIIYIFIITSLINGILVRYLTIGNYSAIKPLLTDLSFLILVSYLGHFFSKRNRYRYFFVWSVILTFICIVNTIYYSNYISFTSVSFLKTATELTGYTGDVVGNILETKQFIFIFQIVIMIFAYITYRKSDEFKNEVKRRRLKKSNTPVKVFIVGTE